MNGGATWIWRVKRRRHICRLKLVAANFIWWLSVDWRAQNAIFRKIEVGWRCSYVAHLLQESTRYPFLQILFLSLLHFSFDFLSFFSFFPFSRLFFLPFFNESFFIFLFLSLNLHEQMIQVWSLYLSLMLNDYFYLKSVTPVASCLFEIKRWRMIDCGGLGGKR